MSLDPRQISREQSSESFAAAVFYTPLSPTPRGLYVGGDGNLVVVNASGDTVTFAGVKGGLVYPIRPAQISSASTATNIIMLF